MKTVVKPGASERADGNKLLTDLVSEARDAPGLGGFVDGLYDGNIERLPLAEHEVKGDLTDLRPSHNGNGDTYR